MATPDYFLVTVAKGPGWDHSKRRRGQAGWDEHAAFMEAVVAEGLIVLGGPVDEVEGELVLHVVDAPDEQTIRDRLGEDPWSRDGLLVIERVEPWFVWLRIRTSSAPA